MGTVDITVLHALGRGEPDLSPLDRGQIILTGRFLEDGMQQW
jgi:hypothetical protein